MAELHDTEVTTVVSKKDGVTRYKLFCKRCKAVAYANTQEDVEKRKALKTCNGRR